MFNKEISIKLGKTRVVGVMDATPESLTVQIQSPYKNLKAGVRFSSCPVGDRRFSTNGKLTKGAIEYGQEILKGLYLAGNTLRRDPDFIKRLRKYMARYEEKAALIQQERKAVESKYAAGRLSKCTFEARMEELRLAEHQNVIGKGLVFRQYGEKLAERSGGRADIRSVLEFSA